MNKEIKEIADSYKLFNYITNLQEENIKLRIQISAREEIINKAIEYINEATNSDSYTILPSGKHTDISYCIVAFEDLLNILKGDNK